MSHERLGNPTPCEGRASSVMHGGSPGRNSFTGSHRCASSTSSLETPRNTTISIGRQHVEPMFDVAHHMHSHSGSPDPVDPRPQQHQREFDDIRRKFSRDLVQGWIRELDHWRSMSIYLRVVIPLVAIVSSLVAFAAGVWFDPKLAFTSGALQLVMVGLMKLKQISGKSHWELENRVRVHLRLPKRDQQSVRQSPEFE